MRRTSLFFVLLGLLTVLPVTPPVSAQTLDKEQKDELKEITKSLSPISRMISRKEFDEAEKILDAAQAGVDRIAKYAKLPVDSPLTRGVRKAISLKRHALEMKRDPEAARAKSMVSFTNHVAPIVQKKCVNCHDDSPQGGLNLSSYENMKKGGRSGPLLIPGNARNSLFMLRLCTPNARARMPRNDAPLTLAERNVLGMWIQQGARYDAEHEDTLLEDLIEPPEELPTLQGWRPTGKESVSFAKHISPWMVIYCLRCHSGRDPQGGLSLESYDALMRGGDSGKVIQTGRPEQSLIYQLVGSFDATRRMPANTSRLTRKNWDDLGVWIHEGAKFDGGDDPKILLRALTPSEEDLEREKIASMSSEDFKKHREERTASQWKQGFPEVDPEVITSDDLLIYSNLPSERLGELEKLAVSHTQKLRALFGLNPDKKPKKGEELPPPKPLWQGRLALFIVSSRSEFETFAQEVTQRRVFDDNYSIDRVDTNASDAYLVLYDPGPQDPDKPLPSLDSLVISELTRTYLSQVEKPFPQWFTLGLGPAIAARTGDRNDPWVLSQQVTALGPLKEITERPADVFKDGAFFSEEDAIPVSSTLVQFLLEKGGAEPKLAQFINVFQQSGSGTNSLQFVYRSALDQIARNYFGWIEAKTRQLVKKQ